MAIDTREKRQSAAGISFYAMPPSVTMNVAKDREWRQEAGWGYSGIAAQTPVADSGDMMMMRVGLWLFMIYGALDAGS